MAPQLTQEQLKAIQADPSSGSTIKQTMGQQLTQEQLKAIQADPSSGSTITTDSTPGPNGPLANLYTNKFKNSAIHYPRDLDALNKGHSVQFDIRDIVPSQAVTSLAQSVVGFINSPVTTVKNAVVSAYQATLEEASAIAETAQNTTLTSVYNNLVKTTGDYLTTPINLQPETTKDSVDTIRLYMPDTLTFNYSAQYDKLSVTEAIGATGIIGAIPSAVTSFLEKNEFAKMTQKKIGYTFNPQQQTLFEGIDFREFEMEFMFTPTTKDEAITIQQIITKLRKAAAPTKMSALKGFFFKPPSVFDITFFFNGVNNYSISPVRRCVLQSVNVNYAPNGWASMRDGSPVQTSMTLSFREINLVDRASIESEKQMQV